MQSLLPRPVPKCHLQSVHDAELSVPSPRRETGAGLQDILNAPLRIHEVTVVVFIPAHVLFLVLPLLL